MISINFASRNYRLLEGLRKGFIAAAVAFALVLCAILWAAVSLRSDIAATEKRIRETEGVAEKIRPLLAERDRITRELGSMSGLVQSRRFSWTRLFSTVETAFPVGVALDKVEYSRKDSQLSLDGRALSPESLRNLIVGLERSSGFKEPHLKHQSLDKGSISFHVVASYHGPQTDSPDRGK